MITKVLTWVAVILIVLAAPGGCKGDGKPSGGKTGDELLSDARVFNNPASQAPVIVYYGKKKATLKPGKTSEFGKSVTKLCTVKGAFVRDNMINNGGYKLDGLGSAECRKVTRGSSITVYTEWK